MLIAQPPMDTVMDCAVLMGALIHVDTKRKPWVTFLFEQMMYLECTIKLCIHNSNWRPHNIVILVRKPYERKPYEPTHKVAHPPSIPTPHPIHAPPTEPIHLVTPLIYS